MLNCLNFIKGALMYVNAVSFPGSLAISLSRFGHFGTVQWSSAPSNRPRSGWPSRVYLIPARMSKGTSSQESSCEPDSSALRVSYLDYLDPSRGPAFPALNTSIFLSLLRILSWNLSRRRCGGVIYLGGYRARLSLTSGTSSEILI